MSASKAARGALSILALGFAALAIATSATVAVEKPEATPNPAAQPDLRGTKAAPLAVEVTAVPGITDEERRERADDRRQNRELVWFTGILALGTIALGVATLLLWRATRRLVLDAADNAEGQLRAYVNVESGSLKLEVGKPAEASVTFKNYGHTPAYKFRINAGLGMAPSFQALPPAPAEAPGQPRGVLAPGAPVILVRFAFEPIRLEHLAMLANGSSRIFVYGEVSYIDAFKEPRVLTYRLMTTPTTGNTLTACEDGNDAD